MTDLVWWGLIGGLVLLTRGLIRLCDRPEDRK